MSWTFSTSLNFETLKTPLFLIFTILTFDNYTIRHNTFFIHNFHTPHADFWFFFLVFHPRLVVCIISYQQYGRACNIIVHSLFKLTIQVHILQNWCIYFLLWSESSFYFLSLSLYIYTLIIQFSSYIKKD